MYLTFEELSMHNMESLACSGQVILHVFTQFLPTHPQQAQAQGKSSSNDPVESLFVIRFIVARNTFVLDPSSDVRRGAPRA